MKENAASFHLNDSKSEKALRLKITACFCSLQKIQLRSRQNQRLNSNKSSDSRNESRKACRLLFIYFLPPKTSIRASSKLQKQQAPLSIRVQVETLSIRTHWSPHSEKVVKYLYFILINDNFIRYFFMHLFFCYILP